MATVLKPATTPDEIAACVRQRFEIYTEEMNLYQDSADHAERSLSDPFDSWARFFCAEVDGVVVAGVRHHWGFDGMEKAGVADAFPADWHDIYDFRSSPRYRCRKWLWGRGHCRQVLPEPGAHFGAAPE